jgi:hypothetical protein
MKFRRLGVREEGQESYSSDFIYGRGTAKRTARGEGSKSRVD